MKPAFIKSDQQLDNFNHSGGDYCNNTITYLEILARLDSLSIVTAVIITHRSARDLFVKLKWLKLVEGSISFLLHNQPNLYSYCTIRVMCSACSTAGMCEQTCATVSVLVWVRKNDDVHVIRQQQKWQKFDTWSDDCQAPGPSFALLAHQVSHFWAFLHLHVISGKILCGCDTKVAEIARSPQCSAAFLVDPNRRVNYLTEK